MDEISAVNHRRPPIMQQGKLNAAIPTSSVATAQIVGTRSVQSATVQVHAFGTYHYQRLDVLFVAYSVCQGGWLFEVSANTWKQWIIIQVRFLNFITNKKRGKVVKVPGLKKNPYSEFLKAQHAKKDLPKGHGDAMTEISRWWSEARQDKNVCAALQESAEAAMAKPLTTQMKESKVKKLMRTISDKVGFIWLKYESEQRKHGLATQLQDMLNSKYSAFKRKSVRFSYKKLDDGDIRVVGLPEGVALKRPASLSSATIRKILSMSHLLHVEEVPKYPPPSAASTAITFLC
ncbi:hypothetical protein CAPTEDRAFT_201808 [Capitella teleta]|uniref:Uncharacterized protein n=1 Tax=Capitella teleta TaxID=283909 RepID=R7UCN7_CAPTE|nr:hypothetical protein CAPTEDRAFT_201808 [Capitella teleta]|eukprot:ELU01548.1 hypothetical protein CAPTEDRAFT_201808 [Capitella teleta]